MFFRVRKKLSLEQEAVKYIFLHKCRTIRDRIYQYYVDLEDGKTNIPNFMRNDSPEKLADRELERILSIPDNGKTFERLYSACLDEVVA